MKKIRYITESKWYHLFALLLLIVSLILEILNSFDLINLNSWLILCILYLGIVLYSYIKEGKGVFEKFKKKLR